MPSDDTVAKVYDNLDFTRALDAFTVRKSDSESIRPDQITQPPLSWADTIYYIYTLDLTDGPIVVETPPDALGLFDDFWFQHVIDFGRPGPDRAAGGKFLLIPPGYDGPMPDSGFHVGYSSTYHVMAFGRNFMENNDPKPVVEMIKSTLKINPYTPGGFGTSIGTLLEGEIKPGKAPEMQPTNFIEGTGLSMNTLPPADDTFYELVNDVVQEEPGGTLSLEIMGALAAIGIIKGEKFDPDERMRGILADAASVGEATGRALNYRFRDQDGWAFYPDSAWYNMLWQGGSGFQTPPPAVTKDGVEPYQPTGYRTLDARFGFFFFATGVTPAMCMRLTGIGSQYLIGGLDADKNPFDGAKTYGCTLPPNVPESNFWSFTVYDNQSRSMLQTPQRFPRAGSQSFPSPAAVHNADDSVDIYFSPVAPEGKESNWIQTVPGKGWFTILRLSSPLEAYFDKSWRVGEIELID